MNQSTESDQDVWGPIDDIETIEKELDQEDDSADDPSGAAPGPANGVSNGAHAGTAAIATQTALGNLIPWPPTSINRDEIPASVSRDERDPDWDSARAFAHLSYDELFEGKVHPDDFCGTILVRLREAGYRNEQVRARVNHLYDVLNSGPDTSKKYGLLPPNTFNQRFSLALKSYTDGDETVKEQWREIVRRTPHKQETSTFPDPGPQEVWTSAKKAPHESLERALSVRKAVGLPTQGPDESKPKKKTRAKKKSLLQASVQDQAVDDPVVPATSGGGAMEIDSTDRYAGENAPDLRPPPTVYQPPPSMFRATSRGINPMPTVPGLSYAPQGQAPPLPIPRPVDPSSIAGPMVIAPWLPSFQQTRFEYNNEMHRHQYAQQTLEASMRRDADQIMQIHVLRQRDAGQTMEIDILRRRDAAQMIGIDRFRQHDAAQMMEIGRLREQLKTKDEELGELKRRSRGSK